MASIKYKCKNCQHSFTGNDYTINCPNCGKPDIISTETGDDGLLAWVFKFYKENKILSYSITAIIIIIILLLKFCGDETTNPKDKFIIEPIAKLGFVELNIYKYDSSTHKKTPLNNFSKYEKSFRFRDKDGNAIIFQENNKYYPCDSDVVIRWSNPKNKPLKNPWDTTYTATISFLNGKPSTNAPCPPDLRINEPKFGSGCTMIVSTSLDNDKHYKVMVSVTGRSGPYLNKSAWQADTINQINVWAYFVGKGFDSSIIRPVPYLYNYSAWNNPNCKHCTPSDIAALKTSIVSAANNYGSDPSNKGNRNILVGLLSNNTKVYLDNNLIGDYSDMNNIFLNNFKNDNTTYKYESSDITSDCEITSIKFKKK
jgi:hypothetical protein